MKQEQQNIAIAEACGWEKLYKGPEPDNRWMSPDRKYCTNKDIPDYLNDLNAMHEAWMGQPEEVRIQMHQTLMDIVDRNFPKDSDGCGIRENMPLEMWVVLTFEATAAQRAEAFLRTIGKWKESKGHLKLDPPTAGDVLDSNAY